MVTVSGVVSNPAIPNPDDVRLTIINDDADLPQDIAIDAPAAVDEGAGTANVTVTLTTLQNTAPVIDAQLFYRQRPGTATRGDDYTRPQGLGNRIAIVPVSAFSANADGTAWVARHSFEIGIVDDGEAERDETIVFEIYNISDNRGTEQTITIRDDDAIAPGRPTDLTAFSKSQTRIQLAWTAPEEHGSFAITGYKDRGLRGRGLELERRRAHPRHPHRLSPWRTLGGRHAALPGLGGQRRGRVGPLERRVRHHRFGGPRRDEPQSLPAGRRDGSPQAARPDPPGLVDTVTGRLYR